MNIKQMKSAIAKFRKADLSVIKDEKLRAKAQQLQNKEKGFTLLELLVVITLIAILATGALVAYENIGESAEAAQAANTIGTLDRAIRTYRAVENVYPNQWDNLVQPSGSALEFAAPAMDTWLAAWELDSNFASGAARSALLTMFEEVGIEELQQVNDGANVDTAKIDDVAPNRLHNESSGDAFEVEIEDGDLPAYIAVVPNAICAADGYPTANFEGTPVTSNELQNSYGDALESDECHALFALGFGGDAAASTTFSNVAIAQSPSYIRTTGDADTAVNPEIHYSRYIGLFHAAAWDEDDNSWDWNDKLRLIAIVAPDGKNLDQLVSEANQSSAGDD